MARHTDAKLRETSAGGVVFDGARVLVVQRSSGEWLFPKGHLEEDEAPGEAALREVAEETGLQVYLVAPLGTTSYTFYNPSGRPVRKTVHWFLMERRGGELMLEPLFRRAAFVPPEEALRLLTFENDRRLLRRALRLRQGETMRSGNP